MSAVQVRRLTDAEFGALRDDWNALLCRSAADNIFLTWEWLHTWWEHFGSNKNLLLLAIEDRGISSASLRSIPAEHRSR